MSDKHPESDDQTLSTGQSHTHLTAEVTIHHTATRQSIDFATYEDALDFLEKVSTDVRTAYEKRLTDTEAK